MRVFLFLVMFLSFLTIWVEVRAFFISLDQCYITDAEKMLLFISYKVCQTLFGDNFFLLLLISSSNLHDLCQRFYVVRDQISAGSDKRQRLSP